MQGGYVRDRGRLHRLLRDPVVCVRSPNYFAITYDFVRCLQASNLGAQALYSKLGFVKDEKMAKYYLNGGDAYRLKLWIDKDPKAAVSTNEAS